MNEKNKTEEPATPPATPKTKAKAKAKARTPEKPKLPLKKVEKSEGLRMGASPDNESMHKIRVRTQTGHRLWLHAIEFWAPGEDTEVEVTSAQLERLVADGRVMIDNQIDDFNDEVSRIGDRLAKRNQGSGPLRDSVPEGTPTNWPGGERNPNVSAPDDAKSPEELVAEERAAVDKRKARRSRRRDS